MTSTAAAAATAAIPGIPRDSAKLRAAYEPGDSASVGINVVYASSQYALGDDNNADVHGRLPAYTVVHLDGRYQATRELQLFMLVNNLFDRRYQSLALLGANAFTGPGGSFGPANGVEPAPEQFRAPGAQMLLRTQFFHESRGRSET